MEYFRGKLSELINSLFQGFLVAYLILLLVEQVWSGTVSFYMNLNYLLIVVIVLGILDVFSSHASVKKTEVTWKDKAYIWLLGIAGFVIIKFKTAELGWLSWMISLIAGILIVLLSKLVLEEDENEEE